MLPIATDVLELEITPNRPDCLGVYGVARELHAATGAPLGAPPWAEDPGTPGPVAGAEVIVECPDLCPRFTARVFEDVTIGPSPAWLKARLVAAGQRPINNVVDITNYVMLLTGQPLHAFDLDRVAGGRLTVRRARDGEQLTTLDEQTRTLDSEMVVIEDGEGPTSIAGVMGGARSEVGAGDERVLLEVANWDGPNIHRTSLDARPAQRGDRRASRRASRPSRHGRPGAWRRKLMIELCGARSRRARSTSAAPAAAGDDPAARRAGRARSSACRSRATRQAEILAALDFGVADAADGLTSPSRACAARTSRARST